MDYLASERSLKRRADPFEILPESQSIVVLGFRYSPPAETQDNASMETSGRIAAYARGKDYHLVLPGLMDELVKKIETRLGHAFPYRYYTDTGPILERDLAQRAGLGWIGKNTCLIHPQHGSYMLLAEILLGIELEIDPPFKTDHCGTCTRCIQACPTGCILPNRTLDANRCISYLTIEHKGNIPSEFTQFIGSHVFGCDICQQVCPWNIKAAKKEDLNGNDEPDDLVVDLMDELKLDRKGFNQKYKDTALMRTRRSRYIRNVLIALENSGSSKEKLEMVRILKNDEDPIINYQATRLLEKWQ